MFQKLKQRWKVNGLQLALIICTFAIGGSLTGYIARKLMPFLDINNRTLWIILYIIIVTALWPITVVAVSIPLGQYSFFIQYIRRISKRMGFAKSSQLTDHSSRIKEQQL